MLPTFVIGLREGLEASLIVGFIAAFLNRSGRRDLLRPVAVGVGGAIVLCVAVGVGLKIYSAGLPVRQQEGLETVIGAAAVAMVTYMVVWMRRNSRNLKGQLEGAAATALADGSGKALVAMAFLAVLREGIETVVFLLAAFNEATSGPSAGIGAALGIAVAVVLGYGIYRGGVRINLSRFFRITGFVLVLVAAGLVVNALHTAHEAGWLNAGQQSTVDLSAVVTPNSVQSSLLTGMLGIQPQPVLIEVFGWLLYLVPVGVYVVWPPTRTVARGTLARVSGGVTVAAAIAALLLAVLAPGRPTAPVARSGELTAQLVGPGLLRATPPGGAVTDLAVTADGSAEHDGVQTDVLHTASLATTAAAGLPARLSTAQVAAANGGRLPIGVAAGAGTLPVTYAARRTATVWVEPVSGRVVDVAWQTTTTPTVTLPSGVVASLAPTTATTGFAPADAAALAAAAERVADDAGTRTTALTLAWLLAGVAVLAAAGLLALVVRRRPGTPTPLTAPPVGMLAR